MRRRTLLLGLMLAIPAASAQATVTVTRSPTLAPDLTRVISGLSATTFSVTTAGVVTRTSGNAIRLSTGTVTTPTITITCAPTFDFCSFRKMQVTIVPVMGTGPASVTKFRVGSLTKAAFRDGAPAEAASMTFVLNAFSGSATFKLGMDVLLAAAAASGNAPFNFIITVALI